MYLTSININPVMTKFKKNGGYVHLVFLILKRALGNIIIVTVLCVEFRVKGPIIRKKRVPIFYNFYEYNFKFFYEVIHLIIKKKKTCLFVRVVCTAIPFIRL